MKKKEVNNKKNLKAVADFIDFWGGSSLAKELNLTPQAIWRWKIQGIPKGWQFYFKNKYSKVYKQFFGD